MRGKGKHLIALLTAALMLTSILAVPVLAEAVSDRAGEAARYYYYDLSCVDDGVGGGTVKLNLSVRYNSITQPGAVLDAGAFGLRFPKWIKSAVFTPSGTDTAVQRIVSAERYPYAPGETVMVKDSYLAFAWFRSAEEWHYYTDGLYVYLDIGTFTLTLPQVGESYQLPGKTAVGLLDWSKADEAAAAELAAGLTDGNAAFDRTLWNPETGAYQGEWV